MAKPSDLDKTLLDLFEAERRVRKLHDEISDGPTDAVLDAVERATSGALEERDADEAALRLERLAMILGELEGPRAVSSTSSALRTRTSARSPASSSRASRSIASRRSLAASSAP